MAANETGEVDILLFTPRRNISPPIEMSVGIGFVNQTVRLNGLVDEARRRVAGSARRRPVLFIQSRPRHTTECLVTKLASVCRGGRGGRGGLRVRQTGW